ncbi:SH3 domain-containing protein [Spirochaeta isovalerica]|uniref:Uncharacterized protein n=1 Tax=Spirochaeta isovalerica TaxID=150 RepID=A0A841RH52_9SPIO|nr:SH3 domain-containing protein [Spirochaeta isovalerica]MBB6482701.1 hypothetical protein [Spirochaeta isovalerica]
MKKILILLLSFISVYLFSEEFKMKYWGTVYLTDMNISYVNVRQDPSLSGKKIDQYHIGQNIRVSGVSMEEETIDNHTGYWVRVNKIDEDKSKIYPLYDGTGWLWSKFINEISDIKPSQITFKEYIQPTSRRNGKLILNINHNGDKREVEVYPHKEPSQNYYTFVWADDMPEFMYYDIPGTYIWYPNDNTIEHVTYYGNEMESAWCIISDDREYLIQDHGTSPGSRGVTIKDIETGEYIFRGSYFRNLNLSGNEIEICYVVSNWNINKGRIDQETMNYYEEYISQNEKPNDSSFIYDVVVKYKYNFITKERIFLSSNYEPFQ